MEEEFKAWLSKMYYDNCHERETVGDKPYENIEVYYQKHSKWLREQFNKGEE